MDEFLEGEDAWESDNDSVEPDRFNKVKFNSVKPMTEDEYEAPVNTRENLAIKEQKELAQARQLNAERTERVERKPSKPSPSYDPPPPRKVSSYKPPSRTASSNSSYSKGASVSVKKASFNAPKPVQRKLSISSPPLRSASKAGNANAFDNNKYSAEVVAFFTEINKKSITQQAIEYLNAYWEEVGDQAEFIFSVAIRIFREADMHRQGISLIYKYDEGCDVDYPTYLYFYEKLVKFVENNPEWRTGQYEKSAVYEVKTAIKHKNDLKEKVDVNFDGRISFLEFLLYQYNIYSNPADYMQRAQLQGEEHPEIVAARLALDEVNSRIRAYEEERARLEQGAQQAGVKGLTFKHQLTMLDKSPLSEKLNEALITAEAAVRIAVKKFQGFGGVGGGGKGVPQGALWWMQRDLEEKKRVVVPATLRRVKKGK